MGSISSGGNLQDPRQGEGQDGNNCFFGFLSFLCFDVVPFVGTPENAGVM